MANLLTHKILDKLKKSGDSIVMAKMLKTCSGLTLHSGAVIKSYHDILLFYSAFPFDKDTLALAVSERKRISLVCQKIYDSSNTRMQLSLMGTGIANTDIICSYSYQIAHWLSCRFPGHVQLESSKASNDYTRDLIQTLLPQVEYEKSSQGNLTLEARLARVSGLHKRDEQLQWLLQLINDRLPESRITEEIYLQLQLYVRWQLRNTQFSRTFLRLPAHQIFYHDKFIRNLESGSILTQKIRTPSRLSSLKKNAVLDIARASLACYYRETEALTNADPGELELFSLGRGLEVALIGMKKERRLSLESYIGYMAFKNGIPVSYGGGWIWGERCKIGINIYPPFRSGESAWLFCQVMRVYYQYFGVRHFIVKPYQFGKGNPEGLRSGAFWFYYKLGFRPANEIIRQEAAIEWEKITRIKKYKTPISTLRHFTSSNKEWKLSENPIPAFDAGKISIHITEMINRIFNGDRKLAIGKCAKRMKNAISFRLSKHPTIAEKKYGKTGDCCVD